VDFDSIQVWRIRMTSNHVFNLAKRRKTVRKFSPTQLNLNDMLIALEAACQAPSGANSQPWRFLVITESCVRRRIREICEAGEREFYSKVSGELRKWLLDRGFSWRKSFLEDAPLLILVLSEMEKPYSKESVWLAIGYILLALEEKGLGTVTYTPSHAKKVLKEVGIPQGFGLEAILPIGASADEGEKEPRLGIDEVTYLNTWGHRIRLTKGNR